MFLKTVLASFFVCLVVGSHEMPKCNFHLKGDIGMISSDDTTYQNLHHSKCLWLIETDHNLIIQLRIITFDFNNTCKNDYIKIFDGRFENENLVGKYCNGKRFSFLQSTSNKLYIVAKFSDLVKEKNFQFAWLALHKPKTEPRPLPRLRKRQAVKPDGECGGILTSESGAITSPNYPAAYKPSSMCKWIIRGDEYSDIVLEFKDFELEAHRQCRYDFVRIRNGEGRNSEILGKYCGTNNPGEIKTKEKALTVEFISDTLTQKRGFKAIWKLQRKASLKDCGGTLTGLSGELASPRYPKTLGNRVICKWTINVPEDRKVRVQISDISISESKDCTKGYVQLKDKIETGGIVLGVFCGTKLPVDAVISTGNKLELTFLSDGETNSRGFKATWSAVYETKTTKSPSQTSDTTCGKLFTTSTGYITRSISNSNCTWKIKVEHGQRISVSFLKVNLANDPDCRREQIEVRDGSDDGPYLTRTCGKYTPRVVTSSENEIEIRHTIFVTQPRGYFKLYWEIYDKNKINNPFNQAHCGIVKMSPQRKINNVPQGLGTLPWVVGIMGMFGRVHCGGTILSEKWILSAAHCFERLPWTMLWKVRAGEWDLTKIEGKEQNRDIDKIFIHPLYNAKTNENDISLIHLRQPLIFNDYVNPACIPSKSTSVNVGDKCSIAGWGARKFLRQPKGPLAHIQPKIVDSTKCNSKNVYDGKVLDTMLCAGGHSADSCQGDGGSGLTCLDKENKYNVIGIASWGNGCAFPDKSGVYTDVRKYLDWMESVARRN